MKFTHYDLGHQDSGTPVTVSLSGSQANVRLLNDQNFRAYRQNRRHTFYGGLVTQSPYRTHTPHADRWHVVIDLGGYPGTVKTSISVG